MEKELKGTKAQLLAEAVKLTEKNKKLADRCAEEIKPITDKYSKLQMKNQRRIEEIQEELGIRKDGTYVDENLNAVIVKTIIRHTTPSVADVRAWFKSHRKGKKLDSVVKVQMTALRKEMPDTEIKKLKSVKKKGQSRKFTFKLIK